MKKLAIFGLGLISVIYLLNPGAGIFELIPDNLPLIGNLDETAAAALLLGCLRYCGIDLTSIFRQNQSPEKPIDIH
jgi:hypothetical protein